MLLSSCRCSTGERDLSRRLHKKRFYLVAKAWTSLTENTRQIDIAKENCKLAEENLDLNTFSYTEGRLTILDVLSAQLTWVQAYTNLIQSYYEQKIALADYRKSTCIMYLGQK